MKYTQKQYARIFLSACERKTEEEQKKIVRLFFRVLKKNRDYQKRDAIFREIEKQHLKNERKKKVVVQSASALSKNIKKEIVDILGKKILYAESIKRNLGAGIKILIDDEVLVDATARGQISKLFHI